jgi:transposase InsO family protein
MKRREANSYPMLLGGKIGGKRRSCARQIASQDYSAHNRKMAPNHSRPVTNNLYSKAARPAKKPRRVEEEEEERQRWEHIILTQLSPKESDDEHSTGPDVHSCSTCGECYWGHVDYVFQEGMREQKIANMVESYLADLENKANEIVTFYEEQQEKEMNALTDAACKSHFGKENQGPVNSGSFITDQEAHYKSQEWKDICAKIDKYHKKRTADVRKRQPYGLDPPDEWKQYDSVPLTQLSDVCEHCQEDPCLYDKYEKEFEEFFGFPHW